MAVEYKDYYKILGIAKDADEKAIKSAYRRLVRKHHPDVNPGNKAAEEQFKDIAEAYEVLSDPAKRSKYDQYGDQWKAYSQGVGGGGFDPNMGMGGFKDFQGGFSGGLDELFASLFGGDNGGGRTASGFRGFRTTPRVRVNQRGAAQGAEEFPVEITFEEAFRGTTRNFQLSVPETCGRCGGQGAVGAGRGKLCPNCGGTGRTKNGRSLFNSECPQCGGSGQAMEICTECHGTGATNRKLKTEVKIPAGVKQGQRIRLAGQGAGGSDIYLKANIAHDPRFERRDDDIWTDFTVPYTVASLGGEAPVNTLDGRKVVSVPAGTQTGTSFRLTGLGMPKLKSKERGNLYARAKIAVPKDLSPRERELLMELAKLRKDEVNYGG